MHPQHQEKCHELIDSIASNMKVEVHRLYHSGGVDVEAFDPNYYPLAKVLVTAAMHRMKDQFAPISNPKLRADVENLIKM